MGRFLRTAFPVVVVALLIAACGSPAQGGIPSTTTPAPSGGLATPTPLAPPPSTAPGAPLSGSPAATPAPATVYRCQTDQLRLSLGQWHGAGGQFSQAYQLTDTTDHSCGLIGYPGMQMLNAQGGSMPTTVTRWGTKYPTVILAPGGVASFEAIWQNGFGYTTPPPSCEFPATMEVTPPNAFTTLSVGVSGMEVCANGDLQVSSVVAGSNPEVYLGS